MHFYIEILVQLIHLTIVIWYTACTYRSLYDFKTKLFGSVKVLCDAYSPHGDPIYTNKRSVAAKIFGHPDVIVEAPW